MNVGAFVIEGVEIIVTRFQETANSTTSRFTARNGNGNTVSGYFLEPAGPSSTVEGSNKRISPGVYNVVPWNSVDHPHTYNIQGVPGRTAILLHPGRNFKHTAGCLLPGASYGIDNVGGSLDKMNQLRNIFDSSPLPRIRIIIRGIHGLP